MLQGVGLAAVMPAVMVLVPGTVSAARLPTAMASVGIAGNVSLALTPPLSLLLLDRPRAGVAVGLAVVVHRGAPWALLAGTSGRARAAQPSAPRAPATPDRRPSTRLPPGLAPVMGRAACRSRSCSSRTGAW